MRVRVLLPAAVSGICCALLWGMAHTPVQAGLVAPAPQVVRPPVSTQPILSAEYQALGQKIQGAMQQRPHFAEGESLPIYKLKRVDPAQVRSRAVELANRVLGKIGGGKAFGTAALEADEDYLFARNDQGVKLRAYTKSGFLSVVNQNRVFRGRCDSLTDTQAAEIARKFVSESKLVELLPNEKLTVADVRHAYSQGLVAKTGEKSAPVLNNVIVILGRELDGKPVIGPGGRVVVFLSGPGEVVGFHRNWRDVEAVAGEKVKGKGPAKAAQQVTAELSKIHGRRPPTAQALRVSRAEFGYFADGKHRAQQFLQPAYAVHVEVRSERAPNSANVIIVSGADRTVEPLTSPPGEARVTKRPATPPPVGPVDD